MIKNSKLRVIITSAVAVVAAVGILLLYILANNNLTSAMKKGAMNNMETALNAKTKVIEEYVSQVEAILIAFGKSPELTELLKNPEDHEVWQKAQNYNVEYYKDLKHWEAVYLGDWSTKTLTHSNEGAIGLVLRKDAESLALLRNNILSADGAFIPGMLVSPASNKLMLSMYAAIFDDDGKTPIGFVGGGAYAAALKEKLDSITAGGLSEAKSYMINVQTGVHIFNEDEDLMAKEIQDDMLLQVIKSINDNPKETVGTIDYVDGNKEKCLAMYMSIPERGWAVVISDTEEEIYADANQSKLVLGILCLVAYIVIVLLTLLVVWISTRPLNLVEKAIGSLKDLNLKQDKALVPYIGTKSEVGHIASAVESLRSSLNSIIGTLGQCTVSLDESAGTMNVESRNLLNYVVDNSATTQELAASISTTNEAISETGRKVGDISEMMQRVAEKIKRGQELSANLIKSAQSMQNLAQASLDDSQENIKSNRKNIEAAMVSLQSLSEINQMTADILSITSQTNLLSLNASIEAARAGEAGRGFAVVADEIGALANSSSQTATNIQNICKDANNNIGAAQKCFDDVIGYLEKDVSKQFISFADSAKEYNKSVNDIQDIIREINEVTGDLEKALAAISVQMDTVRSASGDNELGVEEIINKNEQTSMTAEVLSKVVDTNRDNADKIMTIVQSFKKSDEE